jgi:hypothetical protein
MSDQSILARISALIDEEHRLRATPATSGANDQRLKQLQEQLDQCWDLLRQRRARREYGRDPDSATARDIGTVERYTG